MITRRLGWKLVFAGLTLMAAQASAQTVGRVLMTAGETSAVREGKVLPLTFGSPIEARDTLQTGPRSNLQVRLTDETILSLREQSQMRIENYRFGGKGDEANDSAVFRLVKGAFRTVTGLIGSRDHSRYAVQTPSGTIGIRGTMYAASVCDKDCRNADGNLAPDGLYGMVIGQARGTNKVALTNKSGETIMRQGQVFYVANDSSAPELLLEPPPHLIDSLAGAGKADRPTANALGLPEASDGAVSSALGGLGGTGLSGIASDSRANALPTSLEQVGLVSLNFNTFQATQTLNGGGLPAGDILTLSTSPVGFVNVGGVGVVRGQLLWQTTADMDLHMLPPGCAAAGCSTEVYFGRTSVALPGGTIASLDADNLGGVINVPPNTRVENIQVTGTSVPTGTYTFFVVRFSGVATSSTLVVTGDSNLTSRTFSVPTLPTLSGSSTSQNYLVTRNPSGTATYSGPQ